MKIIKNRKVHWLGFTNKDFIKYYKPHMCDSSSIMTSMRYASFELFDIKTGKWTKIQKSDFIKKPNNYVCNLIHSYGFTPSDLSVNKNWSGGTPIAARLCYRSYVRASLAYHRKLNVKYFLAAIAMAADHSVIKLVDAYNFEMKRLGKNNAMQYDTKLEFK